MFYAIFKLQNGPKMCSAAALRPEAGRQVEVCPHCEILPTPLSQWRRQALKSGWAQGVWGTEVSQRGPRAERR